jgi:hypothetical protein
VASMRSRRSSTACASISMTLRAVSRITAQSYGQGRGESNKRGLSARACGQVSSG